MASMRVSLPVRKVVQKLRMDVAEERSQGSAKMCSLFVVERMRGSRREGTGCERGYGESAMMWAPRFARAVNVIMPSGVNGP